MFAFKNIVLIFILLWNAEIVPKEAEINSY